MKKINLNVFGQNVVISGDFGKLTKRIIDKEERVSFVEAVRAYLLTLDSKLSEGKKKIAEQSIMSLFNKETEDNKTKIKIEKKVEKNKEIAAIKEIATVKTKAKVKKAKIEKSLTAVIAEGDVSELDRLRAEVAELRKQLKTDNEKVNTTEKENRSGREGGGSRWN